MSQRFDVRQNLFRIPDNISVALGLQWDFIGDEPVDLDASCVAFDEVGMCLEAVFFNHLRAEAGYMDHSGDNTTGEDVGEDDEVINFHMNKIPPNVCYLMVCVTSYSGVDFTLVDKAKCRLVNLATKESVGEFSLGIVGKHTGTVMCAFSRVPPMPNDPSGQTWWDLREINIPCEGYTFVDLLPKMLDLLGVSEDQRAICLDSLPDYSLTKEEDLSLVTLSQLKMGLGWDGDNDLDASLVYLDAEGNYVDHVHAKHGKLRTRDMSVLHSGDKLNGYDVSGDDEFIEVDLNHVDKRVEFIFFVALLYDGFAKTLSSVPHSYVRMLNRSSPMDRVPKEIARINLNKVAGDNTAFIFCVVQRQGTAHWNLKLISEQCEGRDWVDVFPYMRNITRYLPDNLDGWVAWRAEATRPFAVEVSFLEARNLGPLEPHHFSCHCEAWVCDRKGRDRTKTRIIEDREHIVWGESSVFVVTLLDCIRVLVYEHAMVGHHDIHLKDQADIATNPIIDQWFPLQGHHITGEVKLSVRVVSMAEVARRNQANAKAAGGGGWCAVS